MSEMYSKIKSQSENSSAKIAFLVSDIAKRHLVAVLNERVHQFDERLITFPMGIIFHRNNFLYRLTEEVMEKVIPAGIPQYLFEFHQWMAIRRKITINSVKGPRVLTLGDLNFGFEIWLSACGMACVGYVMEILRFKARKILRKLIGLTLFVLTLHQRLRRFH